MSKVQETNSVQVVFVTDHGSSGGTKTFAEAFAAYLTLRSIPFEVLTLRNQRRIRSTEVTSQETVKQESALLLTPAAWEPKTLLQNLVPSILREQNAIRAYIKRNYGPSILVISSSGSPGRLLYLTDNPRTHIHILHSYPHGLKHALVGPLLGLLSRKTGQLITVSKAASDLLANAWWISRRRIRVVHNSGSKQKTQHEKIRRPGNMILTVGHVTSYKNPLVWVDIASGVIGRAKGDCTFIWVGDGDLLSAAREKVRYKGLENRIRFVGHQDHVSRFYHKAAVYLQLSKVESLGIAAIDALRHGVPQVVSNVGGLPEVTSNNQTGFVVNQNKPSEVTDALIRIMDDSNLWAAFSRESEERYAAKFADSIWHKELDSLVLPFISN